MRALVAGAEGEQVDAEPVIRAIARHAAIQFARSGIQGRSDPAAQRKPDRGPHGRGRSGRDPRRPRSASAGDRRAAVGCIARRAPQRWRSRRRFVAQGQGHPAAALGLAWPACRRRRIARGGSREDAVRRGRQYDRPPGRARRAGFARGARAAGRARRLLRALPRRPAGARQMVRAAGRGAAQRHRRPGAEARRTSRFHDHQPQPLAVAGGDVRRRTIGRSTRATGAATPSWPT